MPPETEGLPLWLTVLLLLGGTTAATEIVRAIAAKWTGRAADERERNKEEAERLETIDRKLHRAERRADRERARRIVMEDYAAQVRLVAIRQGVPVVDLPTPPRRDEESAEEDDGSR